MGHVLAESDVSAFCSEKAPYYALLEFEAPMDETLTLPWDCLSSASAGWVRWCG